MPDFIPRTDSEFDTWQSAFLTYATANVANLAPLTAGDTADLADLQSDWVTAYTAHIAAQNAAQNAKNAKDAARAAYEAGIRVQVGRLQSSPAVSDAERSSLGITVPDTIRTPSAVPTTRPVLSADTSQRLQITIGFADEGTPTSKAKPAGVSGCEIWVKLGGTPPTDLDDCDFLTLDTRTPHLVAFAGAEANQTAHFIGRWVNTRGEKGPLSETVSATVPG